MRIIPDVSVLDIDYILPPERIAKFPLESRDKSKLLIYKDKLIKESIFSEILNFLPSDGLLLFNNTKVVQARLNFKKETGASIEIFILEPLTPSDYVLSFSSTTHCSWKCIVGNQKRWKNNSLELTVPNTSTKLIAEKIQNEGEGVIIKFSWNNQDLSFARIIELCGEVPIPPYLSRKPVANDKKTYQTVYANPEGSVAAPTAGLHFTKELLADLQSKGIKYDYITLHIGAGTFKPVKANSISDHEMHTEYFFVNKEVISMLKEHKGKIISVGTTTLRTLESLYWLGVKVKHGLLDPQRPFLSQWEPYSLDSSITTYESLDLLENWLKKAKINEISAATQLCIVPGYKFKLIDTLITNYHQPRSTLLLLVAAFIGDDWKRVYSYALENNFRFLSYGDSSLLFRNSAH